MVIEMVDLPIKMEIFHSYVSLPEGSQYQPTVNPIHPWFALQVVTKPATAIVDDGAGREACVATGARQERQALKTWGRYGQTMANQPIPVVYHDLLWYGDESKFKPYGITDFSIFGFVP